MLSVRGIYDGRRIKPVEEFNMPPGVDVIITFMEPGVNNRSADIETRELLELCGTWQDSRPVNEIIDDIYQSRTSSQKEIIL